MTDSSQDPARGHSYDLVGFGITPSRPLSKLDQEELERDTSSLLASLTFAPPGVKNLAIDLRYLALSDSSLTGRHLEVVLLCRLDFEEAQQDVKLITEGFRREFGELLSLHLDPYDYRIRHIPVGEIWNCLQPFKPVDYVEIKRSIVKLRPINLSRFQGKSPMNRPVDMLLRQQAQMCLSIYLESHPMTEDESRELELYGYETDIIQAEDRDLRDLRNLLIEPGSVNRDSSTPFRMTVRLVSDAPISQYVINLLGSEISGRGDYAFSRPSSEDLKQAIGAFTDLRFFSTNTDMPGTTIPESLRNLRHIFPAGEVKAGFRLPTERIATSRERTFKVFNAPVANLPEEGIQLGLAEHPSYRTPLPVRLKQSDRRRHVYVVGKTGTGKSMLLLNMLIQDLNNGKGLCLVDPHGDLVNSVLQHVPENRANDLVLFDPADPEYVAGLNFLEATSHDAESEKDFLTQEVLSMILRMVDYNVEIFGPIAQQMTRMACKTLMSSDIQGTLIEVPSLFSNGGFRRRTLASVHDEELQRYWRDEWEPKTEYQKNEVMSYFTSKYTQFISAPSVRHVVGQSSSSFSFKNIMDSGKILLVNLSRGRLGALNSSALGGMVVSKLLWAATRRAWEPEASRRDFFLYVDEFQNFVSDSFDTILSEARKYRLSLIMAHQHLGQLTAMGRLGDRVERAVFGNAGTLLAFRVGTDAARLADELGSPVDAGTLRSLENRYCIAELLVDDVPTIPFTMRTTNYTPPTRAKEDFIDEMIQRARRKNTAIVAVEDEITSRWRDSKDKE
jgi:hypothetical protein